MMENDRIWARVSPNKKAAFLLACALLGRTGQEILETAIDDAIERARNVDVTDLWLALEEVGE